MSTERAACKPPSLLREELRRAWRELRGGELSPARAAAAVALGVFIGCQPIFGCHTPLVLAICLLLQLDALLAWVASNISNPLVAPFLVTAEVQLGGYLHTGEVIVFSPELAREQGVSGFLLYALSGAPLVGAVLALVAAVLVYVTMVARRRWGSVRQRERYRLPADAPAWWHAAERVAERYAPLRDGSTAAERSRFHYVRVKLMGDPVARLIAELAGEMRGALGELLDVGTGRGQLPILLLELGRATRAQGLDWDADKIAAAERAAACAPALAASFTVEDAATAPLEEADTVLLVDVIHYLRIEEQDALLDRAAAAVRPGGRVIVREADTERGLRSWLTLAEELLFTTLRFNRGARVRFRPAREIADRLQQAGLHAEVRPAWGKTPLSNVLIVATRQAEAGAVADG